MSYYDPWNNIGRFLLRLYFNSNFDLTLVVASGVEGAGFESRQMLILGLFMLSVCAIGCACCVSMKYYCCLC